VKATQSETKTWFDISRNEWEKAKEEKDNFYIVHVRNALNTQATIRVIPNPYKQWEDGYLKAYVVRVSWWYKPRTIIKLKGFSSPGLDATRANPIHSPTLKTF